MQDPMTVAFVICRPWPRRDPWLTKTAERTGRRWRFDGPSWTVAGHGLYWPMMITVWHRDPSGIDDIVCPIHPGNRWRFHVHHWRIQFHPLQQLRRRLLTRCEVCGGRSAKGRPVNVRSSWQREKSPWWRGEKGLAHMDCRGLRLADNTEDLTTAKDSE